MVTETRKKDMTREWIQRKRILFCGVSLCRDTSPVQRAVVDITPVTAEVLCSTRPDQWLVGLLAVMLSAGFCHLLPEALPDIQPGFEFEPDCTKTRVKEFPLGTFLSGLGLLVTLVADQIAQGWSSRCGVPHAHGHSRAQNGAVSRSMSGTMEEGESVGAFTYSCGFHDSARRN